MKKILFEGGFDQLDLAILDELQVNGRISVADLARKIHLSQPAVHNRIKRLERKGVIKQYVALVDREAAGYDLLSFITVRIQPHSRQMFCDVQETLAEMSNVLECYRTAGGHDLLLKIAISDHKALDRFIEHHLMTIPGVEEIETILVLNEVKSTTQLMLKE